MEYKDEAFGGLPSVEAPRADMGMQITMTQNHLFFFFLLSSFETQYPNNWSAVVVMHMCGKGGVHKKGKTQKNLHV